MVVKQNVLTPELFLKLYTSVGWEPPGIDQVRGTEAMLFCVTKQVFQSWLGSM